MKIGRKTKPESPEEMALVHHALENSVRRRLLVLMNQGCLSIPQVAQAVGENMLDYHLHRLELAGLINIQANEIILTESGKAYGSLLRNQAEKGGADKI
jgi:hypothetical protein